MPIAIDLDALNDGFTVPAEHAPVGELPAAARVERRALEQYSILATGLAVGLVWGAWHFPLFWQPDSFSGALPLVILLTRLFSWLPPLRVLLVWVHDRTQSLPVVMVMHAAVSFVSLTLPPETLTGMGLLTSLLASAASMWLLLAVVGVANRRELAHQPLQTNPV